MKNEKMNIYVRFSFVSEHRKMKNRNLWSIQFLFFSFFFLTQNGNETNTEIKEKQPITIQQIPAKLLSFASLNQPRSCSSVSVAMEEDYIILE